MLLKTVPVFLFLAVTLSGGASLGAREALCPPAEESAKVIAKLGPVAVDEEAPSFGGWRLDSKRLLTLGELLLHQAGEPGAEKRALVVTFFATWCPQCKPGARVVDRLVGALEERGARAVFIATGERGAKPLKWLTALGVSRDALGDPFFSIAERYGVATAGGGEASLPKTFVLDGRGRVRAIYEDSTGDFCGHLLRTLSELLESP